MGWRARSVLVAMATGTVACALMTDLSGLGAPNDAGADAAADVVSDVVYGGCDPLAPFVSVVPLGGASTPNLNEFKAALSGDELELWLGIEDDAGTFVVSAKRGALDASFGPTTPDPNLNGSAMNADPAITDDALTIVFSHQPGQVGGWDLMEATRANRTVGFGSPLPVVNVQSTADEVAPWIAADGSLYFASTRLGGWDLFVSQWNGSSFGAPAPLAELNSSALETGIVVTRDLLWAYFASDRAPSVGGQDIYVAHRAKPGDAFGVPQPVAELETKFDERPDWISPDNCRMYFESNRAGGGYPRDIFVASR